MLLIAILLFLLSTKSVLAVGEFTVNQNITYQIENSGNAQVNQEVQLINNYSEIYPKEYQLKLLGSNIGDIKATDSEGNVLQKTENQGNDTIIFIKFNRANLGKNQITKFNLQFQVSNFAAHKGSIWEIQLPDYKSLDDNDSYDITLNVPSSFGNLSFSSVKTGNVVSYNSYSQIHFSSSNLKNKKALLVFGNYQVFDFSLEYYLDNPSTDTISTEIAIPPEVEGQKIYYQQIEPQPENIKIDPDGNWLAQYTLKPQQQVTIKVTGQAKIYASTIKDDLKNKDVLISEQPYWPTNDPFIQKIAASLKTPKDIYNYVVSTLNYNYEGLNSAKRKGALEALIDPDKSLCTEFTDLFVTLARAKGIPAREIEGFAYTNNPKIKPVNQNADILHAWPQFYDSESSSWKSIDPTWAKTTNGIDFFEDLDFNHFIFVIHGTDSSYPTPPGAYKNNRNIKTVKIDFASTEIESSLKPPLIQFNKTGLFSKPEITVTNPNANSLTNINLSIPSLEWKQNISIMAPYGSLKAEMPNISFFKSILPKYRNLSFQIQTSKDDSVSFYSTPYLQHYMNLTILIAGIILILSIGGIILTSNRNIKK